MGIFSRTEPVVVEGEISRIGIIFHSDSSLVYGMHLVGRDGRFWVDSNVGARRSTNDDITMAARGDRVRFGTNPKSQHEAMGFFENKTMAADLG